MNRHDFSVVGLSAVLVFVVLLIVARPSVPIAWDEPVSMSCGRTTGSFFWVAQVDLQTSTPEMDVCQVTYRENLMPTDAPRYWLWHSVTLAALSRRAMMGEALSDRLDALDRRPPLAKSKADWVARQREKSAFRAAVAARNRRDAGRSATVKPQQAHDSRRKNTQQSRRFA